MGLSKRGGGVQSFPSRSGGGSPQVFGQDAWERIDCELPADPTYTPSAEVWNANAIVFTGAAGESAVALDPANMPASGMWVIQNDTDDDAAITITGVVSGTYKIYGSTTYLLWRDEAGWVKLQTLQRYSVPTVTAISGGSGSSLNDNTNPNAQSVVWLVDSTTGVQTITAVTPVIGDTVTIVQTAGGNNVVFNQNVIQAGVAAAYTFNLIDFAVTFMYVGSTNWRVVSTKGGGSTTAPTLVTASVASTNISQAARTVVRRTYAAGTCTLVMPSTPTTGDQVSVKDASGAGATYATVIDGNGKNVDGAATWNSLTTVTPALGTGHAIVFVYDGTEWEVF